jgi:hypothetical protein
MGPFLIALGAVLIVVPLVAFIALGRYNAALRARRAADEAWAVLESALGRRHELVRSLTDVAGRYLPAERGLLEELAAAQERAAYLGGRADVATRASVEEQLQKALGRLHEVAGRAAGLRVDPNYETVRHLIDGVDLDIQAAQATYNERVEEFLDQTEAAPAKWIVGLSRLETPSFFETSPAGRRPPGTAPVPSRAIGHERARPAEGRTPAERPAPPGPAGPSRPAEETTVFHRPAAPTPAVRPAEETTIFRRPAAPTPAAGRGGEETTLFRRPGDTPPAPARPRPAWQVDPAPLPPPGYSGPILADDLETRLLGTPRFAPRGDETMIFPRPPQRRAPDRVTPPADRSTPPAEPVTPQEEPMGVLDFWRSHHPSL